MTEQCATDFEAIEAMRKYGGGFASRLADAWMRADLDNQRKLKNAFPELLNEYRTIAANTKPVKPDFE